MTYKAFYTKSAERDLERLKKAEAVKILKKIDYFINLTDPFAKAKKLKGFETNTYRFRVGDYRVIFRRDGKGKLIILVVLKIIHRKDAYK